MAAKQKTGHKPVLIPVLSALCVCAALVLVILLVIPVPEGAEPERKVDPTEATEAPRVLPVTGDGNPDSLLCRADYTELPFDPDARVAELGGAALTAGQLQAIYYLEVCGYDGQPGPDFSRPLAEQPCPLTEEGLSWQHYFLRRALEDWQLWQGLALVAGEPMPVTEELFQPDEEEHAENFPAGIPAEKVLYGDRDCFAPNSVHQAYLDELPELLSRLAREQGAQSFGQLSGTRDEDAAAAAELMNLAYMFFTESTWEQAKGAAEEADTVSIRHCLLIPEGGASAEETAWTNCGTQARKLMQNWSKNWLTNRNSDANFARLANENSADTGTRADGGLLTGIHKGQLIAPLDAWCFDPARQPGDTEVIRSGLGWHLVYFRGTRTGAEARGARQAFAEAAGKLLERAAAYGDARVDFGAVTLAPITRSEVSLRSVLYPDVGFERFTEVPLYLQQDYGDLRFGKYTLAVGGCGVTCMAMLATYMTDTVYTPAMMAERFTIYAGAGTDGMVFIHGPAELGFYAGQQLYGWENIFSHLQNVGPVVTLQIHGVFTTNGHFMVLSEGHEDGTVTVRDPNLNNYGKLEGFRTDRFTRAQILSGGQLFYSFQPKLVTLPGCSRCGEGSETAEDYICVRCTAACLRTQAFLNRLSVED